MKLTAIIVVGFIHTITADRLESENSPKIIQKLPDATSTFPPLIHELTTDKSVNILRYNSTNGADGSYQYNYATENKILHSESGYLKNSGTGHVSTVTRGSYSYIAPNGEKVTVEYIADENGFQPVGSHIPTPPPVPFNREYPSPEYEY